MTSRQNASLGNALSEVHAVLYVGQYERCCTTFSSMFLKFARGGRARPPDHE
jgi:hypothetical protein